MRSLPVLLAVALLAALALAPGASAATRSCSQTDLANGVHALRASGVSCPAALTVAKRTNTAKCFLNGTSCTHTVRGRSWRCTLDEAAMRVTCRSGGRVVKYRLG